MKQQHQQSPKPKPAQQLDGGIRHHDLNKAHNIGESLSDILETRIQFQTPFPVLDARVFFIRNTRRKRTGPVAFEFVSVIDTEGVLHVYNSNTNANNDNAAVEMLTMSLELTAPLTGVAMDSADAKWATLVVATSDGVVKVIKINVRLVSLL